MTFKRTKIICTLGPASSSFDVLTSMAKNGMDACRLNFSHGDHSEKKDQISTIRKVSESLGKPIAVIADLQGPKLRLGIFEGVRELTGNEKIELSITAEGSQLPIQFDLSEYVEKGHRIFINDGLVELVVEDVVGKTIIARSKNTGWISSKKGLNVPDTDLKEFAFTKKDREDAEFALDLGVDYLAVSFVQQAKDLEPARKLINERNSKAGLIAKIEKPAAIVNLEEIILASDAVIIARGDLAIETSAAKVPILQQQMVMSARQHQTPVIVATQMLESMTMQPRPTRAEASDVANAVLSQADALMLSGESAVGKYPADTVATMAEIIMEVEDNPNIKRYIKIDWTKISKEKLYYNAITSSAASLAYRLEADVLAIATASGKTAKLISAFRPDSLLIAVTHSQTIQNQLSIVWGVNPVVVTPVKEPDKFWGKIAKAIVNKGFAKRGGVAVLISGSKIVGVSGATDTIKVERL